MVVILSRSQCVDRYGRVLCFSDGSALIYIIMLNIKLTSIALVAWLNNDKQNAMGVVTYPFPIFR